VHLDLVRVDDLAAEAQCQVHRQLGLACDHLAHHHHNLALARHSALHACTHTTVAVVREALKSPQPGCVSDPTGNMQNASSLPSQFDLCQLFEVQFISNFLVSVQLVWWTCELLFSKTKNMSTVRGGRKLKKISLILIIIIIFNIFSLPI
jgi:hypothetical protein